MPMNFVPKLKWFSECATQEEAKKRFHELAKAHHPDLGGDESIMQQINAEYDLVANALPRTNAKGETYQPASENAEMPDVFRAAIIAAIHLDGVRIELCGNWLWLTGDTKKHKETLKAAGYRWSPNKNAWYWHYGVYHKRGNRSLTMDEIRVKYGRTDVRPERNTEQRKAVTAPAC